MRNKHCYLGGKQRYSILITVLWFAEVGDNSLIYAHLNYFSNQSAPVIEG